MNRIFYLAIFSISITALLSGCGGGETRPVTGVVTMDGKPLSKAMVTYYPVEGGRGNSNSETDAQGQYTLRYTSTAKGAIPGEYKVLISKTKRKPNGNTKELLPARYNTATELVAEIKSSGANVYDFKLTSDR